MKHRWLNIFQPLLKNLEGKKKRYFLCLLVVQIGALEDLSVSAGMGDGKAMCLGEEQIPSGSNKG